MRVKAKTKIAKILFFFFIITFLHAPLFVYAEECSKNGYTVAVINGVFTSEDQARDNMESLAKEVGPTHNKEKLNIDYLHNQTHLAGLQDVWDAVKQKFFEEDRIADHDMLEMLDDASEKIKTQKVLLVAHSQGNFYANRFFEQVAGQEPGISAESMGVYGIATPAKYVAGDGKYISSASDFVLNTIRFGDKIDILEPNVYIDFERTTENITGHSFSNVYLKHEGVRITDDIKYSLGELENKSNKDITGPCIAPPELGLTHKTTKLAYSILDPISGVVVEGMVGAAYNLAKASFKIGSSIGSAIAGFFGSEGDLAIAEVPEEIIQEEPDMPEEETIEPVIEPEPPQPPEPQEEIVQEEPETPLAEAIAKVEPQQLIFGGGSWTGGNAEEEQEDPPSEDDEEDEQDEEPAEDPEDNEEEDEEENNEEDPDPEDEEPAEEEEEDEGGGDEEEQAVALSNGALLTRSHAVFVSGNHAYVVSGDVGIADNGLEIIDISNADNLIHKSGIQHSTGVSEMFAPKDVKVVGNYAYVVSYSNTLQIIDISNPSLPVYKGSLAHGEDGAQLSGPVALDIAGNYAYVASYAGHGFEVIDISDPDNPTHMDADTFDSFTFPLSVAVSGNYAYLVYSVPSVGSGGVRIYDVSDPSDVELISLIEHGSGGASLNNPQSIHISGSYAYVTSRGGNALEILDISDPANPTHASKLVGAGAEGEALLAPSGVFVSGNYAYVTSFVGNTFDIINISDPAHPVLTASLLHSTSGADLNAPLDVFVSGNYAYITSNIGNALEVVDISDVSDPTHKNKILHGQSSAVATPVEEEEEEEPEGGEDPPAGPALSVTGFTLNGLAEDVTLNPATDTLEMAFTASEAVDWVSITIANASDETLDKIFFDGVDCVDGTDTCLKTWQPDEEAGTLLLSGGGVPPSGTYSLKVRIRRADAGPEGEHWDYFSPYDITVAN